MVENLTEKLKCNIKIYSIKQGEGRKDTGPCPPLRKSLNDGTNRKQQNGRSKTNHIHNYCKQIKHCN